MRVSDLGPANKATLVCIDSYEGGVMRGRFYHPSIEGSCEFGSLSQLLVKLDQALDSGSYPQSFSARRSFSSAPATAPSFAPAQIREGEAANFYIRILFRQNASWQGSVRWLEGEREESFRSALELVFLLDSVLDPADSPA